MRLDRYIAKSRIIDIQSKTLRGALGELIAVCAQRMNHELPQKKLIDELLQRENTMTTYLGNGVAMPHIRTSLKRPYIFAIGRTPSGLEHEGQDEYAEVRLVFLLLAADNEKNYLNVLASLARLFRDLETINHLVNAPNLKTFQERVFLGFVGLMSKGGRPHNRYNRLILREAAKMARATRCAALVLFGDAFAGGIDPSLSLSDFRTILITRQANTRQKESTGFETIIEVRSLTSDRLGQLRSAVLLGLARGIFKPTDRLCCLGGVAGTNQLDCIVLIDVEREFQNVISRDQKILPEKVKVEVLERMLSIATELAIEGREGRPVGCLFVIGDAERVNTMIKPLVLNPFFGYKDQDRNVMNPFMDETIKEFSVIDGCFVIRDDGVIESAGSLIHAPSEYYQDLPGGFGARHSAAAAISKATDCIAVVVSASTGQVTLFRRGTMFPLLAKPLGSLG